MKIIFKILKVLEILLLCILIPILIINLCMNFMLHRNKIFNVFGYMPMIVLSDSMGDVFKKNDLIITKEVDINTLKVNDIITFRDSNSNYNTHRIVNIHKENNQIQFETKGDLNNVSDSELVASENVIGKYIYKSTILGNILITLKTFPGLFFLVICPLVFFIMIDILYTKFIKESDNNEK